MLNESDLKERFLVFRLFNDFFAYPESSDAKEKCADCNIAQSRLVSLSWVPLENLHSDLFQKGVPKMLSKKIFFVVKSTLKPTQSKKGVYWITLCPNCPNCPFYFRVGSFTQLC